MSGWPRRWFGVMGSLLWLGMCCGLAVAQTPPPGRLIIDHKGFSRPQRQGHPLEIEASITSPAGVRKAEVFCRPAGGREFTALPMELTENQRYRATVPDWMTAGTAVEYYITAVDQAGRSASQGFVGFPLSVSLLPLRSQSQEERVKALDDTLDVIRKGKDPQLAPGTTGQNPQPGRTRY